MRINLGAGGLKSKPKQIASRFKPAICLVAFISVAAIFNLSLYSAGFFTAKPVSNTLFTNPGNWQIQVDLNNLPPSLYSEPQPNQTPALPVTMPVKSMEFMLPAIAPEGALPEV